VLRSCAKAEQSKPRRPPNVTRYRKLSVKFDSRAVSEIIIIGKLPGAEIAGDESTVNVRESVKRAGVRGERRRSVWRCMRIKTHQRKQNLPFVIIVMSAMSSF